MLKFKGNELKSKLKVKEPPRKKPAPLESKLGKPDPKPTGEALRHRIITKKLARIWGLPILKSKLTTFPGAHGKYWNNQSWYRHDTGKYLVIIFAGYWEPTGTTHITFKISRNSTDGKLRFHILHGYFDDFQTAQEAFEAIKRGGLVPK